MYQAWRDHWQEVWTHQIAPNLDESMGGAFEEICREHARRCSQEYFSAPAQEIGRIWQADYDIDIAGKLTGWGAPRLQQYQ